MFSAPTETSPVQVQTSKAGNAVKYLLSTSDGFGVEVTYVRRPSKHIICFSTQIGCPVGCRFCVSGIRQAGRRIVRSLTFEEILAQVQCVMTDRGLTPAEPILFSAMGEGEPLLAYRPVVEALRHFGSYPKSRIALSTSGIKPGLIRNLAHENWPKPLKVQFSLHAPNDQLRRRLIPISANIAEVLDALRYLSSATGFAIEVNYVLLDGLNDSIEHARTVAEIATTHKWLVKLNRFNVSELIPYRPASPPATDTFADTLRELGADVEIYETDGVDIQAACGQLSYRSLSTAFINLPIALKR
jgi:23S rRNA (adenine2503-C2)-methyltransferase